MDGVASGPGPRPTSPDAGPDPTCCVRGSSVPTASRPACGREVPPLGATPRAVNAQASASRVGASVRRAQRRARRELRAARTAAIRAASRSAAIIEAGLASPCARDVVGDAVVRARPHDGEPERHVHRRIAADRVEELHRDEPLVVVERDHRVELAERGAEEHRVGRERARRAGARRRGASASAPARSVVSSSPNVALLAGVRVQGRQGDARPRDPEVVAQRAVGDDDRLGDALRR